MEEDPGPFAVDSVPAPGCHIEWDFSEGLASFTVPGRTGYDRREPLTEHFAAWRAGIHSEDWRSVTGALEEHRKGLSAAYRANYRMRFGDDHWVAVADLGVVVSRDADGWPLRIVVARCAAVPDIAARPGVERELVRRHGHALNNQLSVVQGFAELLLEDAGASHPLRRDLEGLRAATANAVATIAALMDAAQ
jgi:hypothetical protein